jgi:hypothetical protein
MYYKVRIKKLPTAATGRETKTGQQKDGALTIQPTAMGGADIDQYIGKEPMRIKDTLGPVDREDANLEAEKGETAYGDLNGDGFPEHYKIGGKRHVDGGTPLNLPDDTFIFSDTRSMKINDPEILSKFGKGTAKGKKSKGYTPAELAKQYDINKFRKILQDPDSDSVSKKTAEIMIRNYNEKLGALSLAQEAKKGYPQGIPMVAQPYMKAMGLKEEDILPTYKPRKAEEGMETAEGMPPEMMEQGMGQEQMPMPQQMPSGEQIAMSPEMMQQAPMAAYGMQMGGYDLPFAQNGINTYDPYNRSQEEIDAANQAFYDRTKDIDASKYFKNSTNPDIIDYSDDMSNAVEYGYADEPWFNMGLSADQLRNFYKERDGMMAMPVTSSNNTPPWMQEKRSYGGLHKAQSGDAGKSARLKSYGDRLMAIKQKYDQSGGKLSIPEKIQMSQELDAIKAGYDKEFGLPASAKGSYGMDINAAIRQAESIGGDIQKRMKAAPATSTPAKTTPATTTSTPVTATTTTTAPATQPTVTTTATATEPATTTTTTTPKGPAKPPYTEKEGYSAKGVVELNKYRKMYGLPQLSGSMTQADIKKAAGELQAKIIETNPELVIDYMSERTHKPNNKLISILPSGYDKTTEGVKKAIADGKLSKDAVKNAYKDDLWWYRALETNTKELSKEEYEKKMKDPGAIKQGDILYFNDDPNNPQLYTQYVMKDETPGDKKVDVPETEEKDESIKRDPVEDVDIQEAYQQPLEWTRPDKRNLMGAIGAKYNRRKYYPWAPMVDLEVPAPNYVDPTGALQQQAGAANTMTRQLAQFTGGQNLSGRASAIQGQLAGQAAETLANYNNQNVGIKNQFAQNAATTRNQNRLQNQAIAKSLYDDNVKMNQQWDVGTQAYNAGILGMLNAGDKNAADIYNISSMSDQYGIDPETLAYYFKGGKDITPQAESNDFNDMVKYYVETMGFDPNDAVAAATQAMKAQKGSLPGVDVDAVMQNYAKNGGMFIIGSNLMPQLLL